MRPLIRSRPMWHETDNPGGYGNVTIHSGALSYWALLKRRFRKPQQWTVHIGWEDETGEYHEEDSWDV